MTWKVRVQGDGAVTNGGDLVQEPSLVVPTAKGIVDYGQPTCLGFDNLPTTPVILNSGNCNGESRKMWMIWTKDGGGTTTFFELLLTSGVPYIICPNTFDTGFISSNNFNQIWAIRNSTTSGFLISHDNQFGVLKSSIYIGYYKNGAKADTIKIDIKPGYTIPKECITFPYDGGFITFLPVAYPMS